MNRQRNSDQNSSTPYRRTSLNSTRNESSSNSTPRNVQTNRSDSAIDVRTPVQQRLKRLQSNLREEQLRKANLSATATTPMTTTNNNQRQSLPARLPAHVPSPPSPVEMMVMSPPKKQLKRRSDFNQNDVQSVKKSRFDKSPSPIKSSGRKIASRHSFPKVQESHKYENDIEMTDATIQEEISSLRENPIVRADYSLSMTINSENKLVINYQDHNDEKATALQKRLIARQSNASTLHIVVDTNIFIKDLSVLPKLMARQFPDGLGYPIIVIPYIVLKELENLAYKRKGSPIEVTAKMANKYINQQFTAKNAQIKGQNAADHMKKLLAIESGDDDVLNCCLQVKGTKKKVILLSNDVNLRNKALFNEIPAFSISGIEAKDLRIEFTEL